MVLAFVRGKWMYWFYNNNFPFIFFVSKDTFHSRNNVFVYRLLREKFQFLLWGINNKNAMLFKKKKKNTFKGNTKPALDKNEKSSNNFD